MEVKLDSVLDLTDPDVLQKSGLPESSPTDGDIRQTREIAAEARKQGYEALLAPSAAASDSRNVVIFLDKASARPNVLSSRPVGYREKTA